MVRISPIVSYTVDFFWSCAHVISPWDVAFLGLFHFYLYWQFVHPTDQFDILEENESYERNLQYFQKKKIEIQKLGSSTREAVVVDLFGGIGSALVCLKRIGIAIRVVIHVDHDKIANVVYRHNHADDGIKHVIVEKLDEFEEKLDYLSEKYGRKYIRSLARSCSPFYHSTMLTIAMKNT